MSGRQLEFLLKMRDQATGTWNRFKSRIERDVGALRSMMSGLGGIVAGIGGVAAIRAAIAASNEQEEATTRLSSALQTAGIWSAQLQRQMEGLSTKYQRTTRFSDEQVTSVQAMLVAMTGLAGEAIEPLTKATLDLAEGMTIDAEAAAKLVGRALAGGAALGKMAIHFEKNATTAEKMATIIDTVNGRFGDMAGRQGAAASGRLVIMKHQFDELLETVGNRIKEVLLPLLPALNGLLALAGKVVNVIVFGLSAGFAELFGQIAWVGMQISSFLEKIGLSTKEKTAWYKAMWISGTTRANEYSQKLMDVFKAEDESTTKISAKGKAMNEADDAATALLNTIDKMGRQEIEFISPEQVQRFKDAEERAEHIAKWLAQSLALRRDLIVEEAQSRLLKPLEQIPVPSPVDTADVAKLTEFEERMVEIQDLSKRTGEIMMNAFDSGIDGMIDAMVTGTQTMAEAFSSFAKGVIADLLKMIAKALIWKLITFGLSLLPGGGILTQFGAAKTSTAAGGGSPVLSPALSRAAFAGGGGGQMNIVMNVSAMDARSVREWLGKTEVRSQIVASFRDAWNKEKT